MMRELRPQGSVYKVESFVGQGQTATVFRAIREDSEGHSRQTVALKILKSRTAVPWLRREFETLARVNSPHCVRVLGWENLPEGCALVLEWIDGATLFELGKWIPFDEVMVKEVTRQVQEGLLALKDCGLHHGDLSPSNILLDRDGNVRIVDFATEPPANECMTGTPAYLAPETWDGCPADLNADFFALGLIECDLRTAFRFVPKDIDGCRERAKSLTTEDPGYFCQDPRSRNVRFIEMNADAKAKLANGVRAYQASLATNGAATVLIPVPTRRRLSLLEAAISISLSLVVSAAPVGAQAPMISRSEAKASLVLRSQNWIQLTLNGRALGYAPVEARGLEPGLHRITWKSATRAGERRIRIAPGSTLRLSEKDLLNSSTALR